MRAEADQIIVSCDPEFWGGLQKKRGVLYFIVSNLRNDASYVLDQYRTLIGSCIWQME